MRLSVEQGDPGYGPAAFAGGFRILLDGEEQRECVTADEELGYIKRYRRDDHGWVVLDGNRMFTEECHGVVTIVWEAQPELVTIVWEAEAQPEPEPVTVRASDYRVDVGAAFRELMGRGIAVGGGAMERSLALLCAWLAPAQLAEFEHTGSFVVTGSLGTRYRIGGGLTEQLGDGDVVIARWCFGPEGALPIHDVMLARKIALEIDEAGALEVANRQIPYDFAGGFALARPSHDPTCRMLRWR